MWDQISTKAFFDDFATKLCEATTQETSIAIVPFISLETTKESNFEQKSIGLVIDDGTEGQASDR